jgi:hypothetical protein
MRLMRRAWLSMVGFDLFLVMTPNDRDGRSRIVIAASRFWQ